MPIPMLMILPAQADLVGGFVAYSGINISVPKAEVISIFNNRIMMYDSPFLTLHD